MRFLGEIEGQEAAQKFVAFLLTEKIDTHIELARADSDLWEVWVRDEDELDRAQQELEQFEGHRGDPKYAAAVTSAQRILEEKEKARREAARKIKRVESNRQIVAGGGRMPPLTLTLFILCIGIGILTLLDTSGRNRLGRSIDSQLEFVNAADFKESEGDPAASLKKGEVWRVITPIFLHGSLLHLAMNMFMLAYFGKIVERWIGTPKFALLVLVLAVVPNLFQGLSPEWMHGSPHFVGISGVLYGLFGYIWIRSSMNPSYGISIPFPMIAIVVGVIVIGLSGVIPNWNLADLCHLGGLLVGCAFGYASEQAAS